MSGPPIFAMSARDTAMLAAHLGRSAARGEPLAGALRVMAGAGGLSGTCARHCALLADRVEAGEPLSVAMAAFPLSFRADDIALVAAGEQARGDMREAFDAWAGRARERAAGVVLAKGAILYPAVIALATLNALAMLSTSARHEFTMMYREAMADHGVVVPLPMALGAGLLETAALALAAAGLITLACVFLLQTRVRAWLHRAVLAMPIAGSFARRDARCVALELIAAFLRAGGGVPEALRHAAVAQGNEWLAGDLRRLADRLAAGESLPREATGPFDRAALHALRAALASEDAATSVRRLARAEARASARAFERFASVAPPAVLLVVGLASGLVLAAIYEIFFGFGRLLP